MSNFIYLLLVFNLFNDIVYLYIMIINSSTEEILRMVHWGILSNVNSGNADDT